MFNLLVKAESERNKRTPSKNDRFADLLSEYHQPLKDISDHFESHKSNVSSMVKTKVLVTGGSGYVGFAIAKKLSKLGYSVIIFDKRQPPEKDHEEIHFVSGSICDLNSVKVVIYRYFWQFSYHKSTTSFWWRL